MNSTGETFVTDMLALLKEDWIPDDKKLVMQDMLISAIDNMKDYVDELERHK